MLLYRWTKNSILSQLLGIWELPAIDSKINVIEEWDSSSNWFEMVLEIWTITARHVLKRGSNWSRMRMTQQLRGHSALYGHPPELTCGRLAQWTHDTGIKSRSNACECTLLPVFMSYLLTSCWYKKVLRGNKEDIKLSCAEVLIN